MKRLSSAIGLCALTATPVMAQDCPLPPDPVLALTFDSRYAQGDETRSVLDKTAEAEALAALKPVEDFLRELATRTEAMLKTDGAARQAQANCIVGHLAHWARADALSDQRSKTVRLTIGSRLAAMAIMLRAAVPFTTDYQGLALSRDWLAARIEDQMRFWEIAPNGAAQGNLRAWAALAAATVADLTDDPVMRGWAAWSVSYVLCSANGDGALPQEMTRGRLALHYQLHALAPLTVAVLMLERQGVDIKARCAGALQRAAQFALTDLATGARTAALTGAPQSVATDPDGLKDYQLAWLEPYLMLFRDPMAETLAAPRRPLSFSKLGGNQTLLWSSGR